MLEPVALDNREKISKTNKKIWLWVDAAISRAKLLGSL